MGLGRIEEVVVKRRCITSVLALVGLGVVGCGTRSHSSDFDRSSSSSSYESPVYSVTQSQAATTKPVDPALDKILRAPDPSSAIDAYAQAVASGADKIAIEDAFVRRMVDLGVPELAGSQAADLNQHAPENGLAWGVSSYVSARKNDTTTALTDIVRAADKAPNEAFVQRIAGQLVAWFELRADRKVIVNDLQEAVANLKTRVGMQPAFVEAYDDARNIYAGVKSPPGTQPSARADAATTGPSTDAYVTAPAYGPPAPSYVYPYEPYVAYPQSYAYDDDYYYSGPRYERGYWWYPSYYSGGYFGSTIFISPRRFHHFRDGNFRDHHRDGGGQVPIVTDRPLRPSGPVLLDRPETQFPQSRMIGPLPPSERNQAARQPVRTEQRGSSQRDSSQRDSGRVQERDAPRAPIRIDPSVPPARDQGPKPAGRSDSGSGVVPARGPSGSPARDSGPAPRRESSPSPGPRGDGSSRQAPARSSPAPSAGSSRGDGGGSSPRGR
jgi:hypothetical protein